MSKHKYTKCIIFLRTFQMFKYDIKQTCSTINEALHCKKKKSLPSAFSHKGKMLRDLIEIANSFNQYFTDIGLLQIKLIPIATFGNISVRLL